MEFRRPMGFGAEKAEFLGIYAAAADWLFPQGFDFEVTLILSQFNGLEDRTPIGEFFTAPGAECKAKESGVWSEGQVPIL